MIIGAYAAGLAFGRLEEREQLEQELGPVIELFTPLFFVLVGASIELHGVSPFSVAGRSAILGAGLLFVVAVLGKALSPLLIARSGMNLRAIGSAMVPRGEVGLIFAQIGLATGALAVDLFSSLALVIAATTVVGPIMLRRSLRRGPGVNASR